MGILDWPNISVNPGGGGGAEPSNKLFILMALFSRRQDKVAGKAHDIVYTIFTFCNIKIFILLFSQTMPAF